MSDASREYLDLSRPIRELQRVVEPAEADMRLDAFLRAHFPWRSRAHFQRMLARGDVLLDDRRAKPSSRVKVGARVAVKLEVDPEAPEQESADDLVFLYEDEAVAAIDKPSGMAVHPVGRLRHGTLINKLHARYRSDDPRKDVVPRLGHRLDQDTSGVVLFVKSREADQEVTDAFTERRVAKAYRAIVEGVPRPASGIIDAPLARDPDGDTNLQMRVDPTGQPARSRWQVLRAFRHHALVELEPLTGRTHQLRVHLAHLGHPIVCDHLYGDLRPLMRSSADPSIPPAEDGVLLERLALHSHRLALDHPVTGEPLTIESPLPEDLSRAVAALERMVGPSPKTTRPPPC